MVDAVGLSDNGAASNAELRVDEIARLSDTIAACDRLCLLSSRSVVQCAIEITKKDGQKSVTFIPSVSPELRNADDGEEHPTTSAQCVTALQHLLPTVERFRLGTQESRQPAFYPIERSSLEVFEPRRLSDEIRQTVDRVLATLHEPPPSRINGGLRSDDSAVREILTSQSFEYLHPFTAAHVLRAIAPSKGMYGSVWWRALFTVLWFLNRRGSSLRGYPNIQATKSPGTAFLTSHCINAIKTVLEVFERRRDRFKRLLQLMIELSALEKTRKHVHGMAKQALIPADLFRHGQDYRERTIAPELKRCVDELALDSALPRTYGKWQANLASSPRELGEFGRSVVDSFSAALNDQEVREEHELVQLVGRSAVAHAKEIHERVRDIHDIISYRLDPNGKGKQRPIETARFDDWRSILPHWICSDDYWTTTRAEIATLAPIGPDHKDRTFLESLEAHWRRHRDASGSAAETTDLFNRYLTNILGDFAQVRDELAGITPSPDRSGADDIGCKRIDAFLTGFLKATQQLTVLRQHLSKDVETGVRWAAVLMNRHLAFASSNALTQFDPSELAHALLVVCEGGSKVHFDLIVTALDVLCAAQRVDGTWVCQQPFSWTKTGSLSSTLSIDTADAIVSTINAVLRSPERYGVSLEECSARLEAVFKAPDRFFNWLSRSVQSFPKPPALGTVREAEPPLYGWCSDRVHEQGRIHSWATTAAIEFLVAFRRLQQERINSLLRAGFLSHHPEELKPLIEVGPTDLRKLASIQSKEVVGYVLDENAPVILQLSQLLQDHKLLELAEGPWLPGKPVRPKISFWSGIFYGPPGTSKTFLAKAIAAELRWPLVSLSPSDFLTKGAQQIEERAKEVFSALGCGSRLVYFFDEIDELIRDRRQTEKEQRSAFSFLTPSFLTKLQELRDAAKNNEFIFILATNYYDRIDTAAKRSGRIDREFPIVYPDLESRAFILYQYLLQKCVPKGQMLTERYLDELGTNIGSLQNAWNQFLKGGKRQYPRGFLEFCALFTGFMSYQKIQDFLGALVPKEDGKDIVPAISSLCAELERIDSQRSIRFRPEIKLADYSDRPEALDEIREIVAVFPHKAFPWNAGNTARSSTRHVERQLTDLYEKAGSAFKKTLKREFRKYL